MNPPNVLLVVLDSVSAGRLSCYGYERKTTPFLDDLASDAERYTNVYASSSWTVPTHASLFTGLYPEEHGANASHRAFDVTEDATLAGQLADAEYRTVGLSTNPWISTDFGYDTGFNHFEDVRPELPFETKSHPRSLLQRLEDDGTLGPGKYVEFVRWTLKGNPVKRAANMAWFRRCAGGYADGDALNGRVFRWLDRNEDEHPFFMFLNYMDAHEPYDPAERYLTEFRDSQCDADVTWHLRSIDEAYGESERQCINDKYDASLRYLDERIRELFEELESRGLLDDTVVLVTADHGKCLGEHGYMGVGTYLYDELVTVPLIVWDPGEYLSMTTGDTISHVDIYDAVLGVAGRSTMTERPRGAFSQTLGPHQDVDVATRTPPAEGQERLDFGDETVVWDVASDEVVAKSESADERQFGERRRDHHEGMSAVGGGTDEAEMDDGVRNQLEELGYL